MTIRFGLGLSITAVLVIMACCVLETIWRFEHTERDEETESSPRYGAKVFHLPEDSVLPYGQGVFVKHRSIPFWFLSRLAFAGYCGPKMSIRWRGDNDLLVECTTDEALKQVSNPDEVMVTHVREPEPT
jgi:hypothetical protein